ncbi:DUF1697 domain-containing protein [Microbacterium sp.]|uniref:DUF1697 domain-containing protein n=1 Tax=Microbacterium sp. TaxID=51671 RepID=UPI003A87DAEA
MATHLAFLRAINLGAKRVFPKADLRRVVAEAGFEDVDTHLNTGNVGFDTRMRSVARIAQSLRTAFAADRGFEVPTVVFPAGEFAEVATETARLDAEYPGLARHYVYLLPERLSAETEAAVEKRSRPDVGRMLVRGRAVHALLEPGYQAGNVDPLGVTPLLGDATNRNATVVRTLAQKWC